MARTDLELRILEALEVIAASHDIDIVDVEIAGSGRAPIVRIRIDHADETLPTITLDEISQQNSWIDSAIEEMDPFAGSFTLEVSSPGMDRPLRRPHDYERFAGEMVALLTNAHEGRRRYTGKLAGIKDGKVVIICDDGSFAFDIAEIQTCKIKPDFEMIARTARKGSV